MNLGDHFFETCLCVQSLCVGLQKNNLPGGRLSFIALGYCFYVFFLTFLSQVNAKSLRFFTPLLTRNIQPCEPYPCILFGNKDYIVCCGIFETFVNKGED